MVSAIAYGAGHKLHPRKGDADPVLEPEAGGWRVSVVMTQNDPHPVACAYTAPAPATDPGSTPGQALPFRGLSGEYGSLRHAQHHSDVTQQDQVIVISIARRSAPRASTAQPAMMSASFVSSAMS
jgi:hypothetical protein